MKQLGIIIVTHNSERHIGPLLRSLAATIPPGECEICVLDSASTDETVAAIEREQASLRLPLRVIREEENIGFARGNNQAYAALQAGSPCEHIMLLNPDTIAHEGWWPPLLAELGKPGVGTAAPLLLLPDGTVNSRGNALHFLGLGFVQGYGESPAQVPDPPALFSGSGAAVGFRVATLEAMNAKLGTKGIFWEELYLYAEDTDLGWRMRLVGLDNRLVPASRVTHNHAFRFVPGQADDERMFWIDRNRYLLLKANLRSATLLCLAPWIIGSELAFLLRIWRLYPDRDEVQRDYWRTEHSVEFIDHRRAIQAGRTASDHAILCAMTGSIRHGALPFRPVDPLIDSVLRASHSLLCAIVRW